MQRDGARQSLWQTVMPVYRTRYETITDNRYDVLIIGGGITGLTTALELQKAGMRCILIEAFNIGFGTTGGTTAHLNTLMETPYYQVESDFSEGAAKLLAKATKRAINLVKSNVDQYNIDCSFAQLPAYLYSEDEKQTQGLTKILDSFNKAGLDASWVNEIPLPVAFDKAAVFQHQAQIHPTRYIYGLAKAFEDLGGILLQNCRAGEMENQDGMHRVNTNLGNINARNVVYATHIPLHINLLHFRCAPYRSYAMAVKLQDGNYPEALVYDMRDPYYYYRTQIVDGNMYLVAGGEDHKTGHEENTEICFRNLQAHLRKHFKIEEISFKWSAQYYEPADGLPYIGKLPGFDSNVFVATGFGGNGITYGSVSGFVLADLITKSDSEYKDLFNPNRVKPVAGFTNFVKENADVVKEFVKGRLAKEKINSFAEIATGEAKVVKMDGDSIAVYKDENGELHAVSPVCNHAKCIVAWNTAEKSWDCPCHGARYNADGEVITAPAHSHLTSYELYEDDENNEA